MKCDRCGAHAVETFWFRDEWGLDHVTLCPECIKKEKPENDPDFIDSEEVDDLAIYSR